MEHTIITTCLRYGSQQTYPIAARIAYNYYINTFACGRRQIEYRYLLRIHVFVYCKNELIVVAAAGAADVMLLRYIFHFVYHNKFMHRILSDREVVLGGAVERGNVWAVGVCADWVLYIDYMHM